MEEEAGGRRVPTEKQRDGHATHGHFGRIMIIYASHTSTDNGMHGGWRPHAVPALNFG